MRWRTSEPGGPASATESESRGSDGQSGTGRQVPRSLGRFVPIADPKTSEAAMQAIIETTRGSISFRLQPKEAPNTCNNFVKLAKQGFYDNLTWHRVIDNFVIQ